jgi:hypothetical protein
MRGQHGLLTLASCFLSSQAGLLRRWVHRANIRECPAHSRSRASFARASGDGMLEFPVSKDPHIP